MKQENSIWSILGEWQIYIPTNINWDNQIAFWPWSRFQNYGTNRSNSDPSEPTPPPPVCQTSRWQKHGSLRRTSFQVLSKYQQRGLSSSVALRMALIGQRKHKKESKHGLQRNQGESETYLRWRRGRREKQSQLFHRLEHYREAGTLRGKWGLSLIDTTMVKIKNPHAVGRGGLWLINRSVAIWASTVVYDVWSPQWLSCYSQSSGCVPGGPSTPPLFGNFKDP